MKKPFIIALLAVTFSMSASATDWSELIGKELVLYRWGEFQDNRFSWIRTTNPAGERPVERMVLTDDTHLEWKYSLDGDFTRECSIEGEVMTLKEPLFGNNHLRIVECDGEVLLASGEDNLTRAFSILNPKPEPSQLPASVGSKKGFCDGKLNDLLPYITDVTYSSRTPMGRNFLHHRQASLEDKVWLESTKEVFDGEKGQIKAVGVNLFPNGKPVLADVHQKSINDCNAMSVLADMAFLYPEFIKSIIHQEAADSFRVDMFDPDGKPITVCVSNRFPVREGGYPIFCVGEGDTYCWISIMEKAAMKWIKVYNHINNSIEGCNAEWITPMFTGDGRSFCIQPGRLESKDLARMINTCLENGLMVNGGFLKPDIPLDKHKTITNHGHTFLPPQCKDALYAIRNPWGNNPNNHIMNLMSDNTVVPPLIDIRVISPGAAAKYFDKNAVKPGTAITKTENLFPSNWRNMQTGEWEIGFFNEFAIYDCQFWDYKQKLQKDDKYTFVLENNGKEITVNVGNLKKGFRTIEIAGKKGNYDIINTPTLPDYPTKDTRTGFVDNGYQTDTVTLVGWLKDMPEWARDKGSEFNVEIWNIFNSDEQNTYSKMDSLGRFSLKIPVLNTSEAYIDWRRVSKATPIEPGKTYFLFKDFKNDQILWMGDDVRVQNEILACGTHGVYVPTEGEMDEEAVMKFFEKVKAEKESAMNKLQKVAADHPTVSDRYFNYVKGDINICEGRLLTHARFLIKNNRLPMQILGYLSQQVWQQRIQPFTLFRDFKSFTSDYIEQFVSHRYREYLEDGRTYYYPYREQLFAPILRKYRDKGKITITDDELAIVSHYAKTHEGIDEYAPIISRKDINKIIWEDEAPLLDLYYTLDIMDSIGCDQELRDIIITQELYMRKIKNYDTLTNCMMQFFEENVKMPAAKSFIKAQQERLLALQHSTLSNAVSIKSAEDVANMTDGEKMLRKLIEPYKDKIILLDIWGTWCAPCKEGLSHSQEEYERLKNYDIVYLYLANRSSDEAWKSVIKKYNVVGDNVVHYNLPQDQQTAIENFLNVSGFPTYKLIDREGNILDVNADPRDLEGLAGLLDKMNVRKD